MSRKILCALAGLAALAVTGTPAHASRTDTDQVPAAGHAHLTADRRSCPVADLPVPENTVAGEVTDYIAYGQTLTVEPYADRIWAGVWFTGTNGPEGWTGTSAPGGYPAPGAPEYSLVGRLGNGAYEYVGASVHRFTNTTPGYLMRVRLTVNDSVHGNGSGAFRVFVRYPCFD